MKGALALSTMTARCFISLLVAAGLLGGCSPGVTPRQMEMDAEITYGLREQKILFEKRIEFDQLTEDFLLTHDPVFLAKMAGTMARTELDIDKARSFLELQRPYHRGIAKLRWETANEAMQMSEKQLCEMLLITSELHILYGDPAVARVNLDKLSSRFSGDAFSAYRDKAALLSSQVAETNIRKAEIDNQ